MHTLKALKGDTRWSPWTPTAEESEQMRRRCDHCGAQPGQRCRKPGGHLAPYMHKAR